MGTTTRATIARTRRRGGDPVDAGVEAEPITQVCVGGLIQTRGTLIIDEGGKVSATLRDKKDCRQHSDKDDQRKQPVSLVRLEKGDELIDRQRVARWEGDGLFYGAAGARQPHTDW